MKCSSPKFWHMQISKYEKFAIGDSQVRLYTWTTTLLLPPFVSAEKLEKTKTTSISGHDIQNATKHPN